MISGHAGSALAGLSIKASASTRFDKVSICDRLTIDHLMSVCSHRAQRAELLVQVLKRNHLEPHADLRQHPNRRPAVLCVQFSSAHEAINPGHLANDAPLRCQRILPPLALCLGAYGFIVRVQTLGTLT